MNWFRRLREAPVTCALIAANLLVYVDHVRGFGVALVVRRHDADRGRGVGLGRRRRVSHWRWLTAAFIHANLLHILMNLWVLGQIGVLSEKALGRGLYAATYVVTGVVGNVLSTVIAAGRPQMTVSVGASGAIMGLIGMAATFAWRSGQRAAAKALAFNILFVLGVGLSLSARGSAWSTMRRTSAASAPGRRSGSSAWRYGAPPHAGWTRRRSPCRSRSRRSPSRSSSSGG